jgi:hypothetical protein
VQQIGPVILSLQAKMIYAKDQATFDSLKAELIAKAKELGIDNYDAWFAKAYADAIALKAKYVK